MEVLGELRRRCQAAGLRFEELGLAMQSMTQYLCSSYSSRRAEHRCQRPH
jgi:hypothetical protein